LSRGRDRVGRRRQSAGMGTDTPADQEGNAGSPAAAGGRALSGQGPDRGSDRWLDREPAAVSSGSEADGYPHGLDPPPQRVGGNAPWRLGGATLGSAAG